MAQERQPKMLIAVGRKGVGKTIETIKFIYEYIQPTATRKARKALIFDVNNEFSSFYFPDPIAGMVKHSIKRIAIKDIPKFSNSNICEVRRVAPYWDNNTQMTTDDMSEALNMILQYYRNGLLLVEDINLYTNENMKTDLIGRLATLRHIGIDLVAHYQGIGRAFTPKIIQNTAFIRMHKTNDSVATHASKAEEKVDILSIAENIVAERYDDGIRNKNENKYYSILVDLENSKIIGDFSKEEADSAVMNYLSLNSARLIKPYVNKRDSDGKKVMNEEQAYLLAKKRFIEDYFSFN
jgi:hypothetical protein